MAGHRDDGTFAEDKAHHPNRRVGRTMTEATRGFMPVDTTKAGRSDYEYESLEAKALRRVMDLQRQEIRDTGKAGTYMLSQELGGGPVSTMHSAEFRLATGGTMEDRSKQIWEIPGND
jgi:hypothetical protein